MQDYREVPRTGGETLLMPHRPSGLISSRVERTKICKVVMLLCYKIHLKHAYALAVTTESQQQLVANKPLCS